MLDNESKKIQLNSIRNYTDFSWIVVFKSKGENCKFKSKLFLKDIEYIPFTDLNGSDEQTCYGSLIADHTILTLANCIANRKM